MSASSGSKDAPTLYEQAQAMAKKATKPRAKSKQLKSASKVADEKMGDDDVKPSRHLGRRNTEDAADRAIQEQFPHSSLFWRHNHRDADGHRLRDVVIAAKREVKRSRGRLGPTFWTSMRRRFQTGG